jgi:hypothetical protein
MTPEPHCVKGAALKAGRIQLDPVKYPGLHSTIQNTNLPLDVTPISQYDLVRANELCVSTDKSLKGVDHCAQICRRQSNRDRPSQ